MPHPHTDPARPVNPRSPVAVDLATHDPDMHPDDVELLAGGGVVEFDLSTDPADDPDLH